MDKYYDKCPYWEKRKDWTIGFLLDMGFLEGECGSCKYCNDAENTCDLDKYVIDIIFESEVK